MFTEVIDMLGEITVCEQYCGCGATCSVVSFGALCSFTTRLVKCDAGRRVNHSYSRTMRGGQMSVWRMEREFCVNYR